MVKIECCVGQVKGGAEGRRFQMDTCFVSLLWSDQERSEKVVNFLNREDAPALLYAK